ncbi:type IV pilin protein [Longimicrobium sp.]|uniref:type IV pilin protein n=1 Tax=Longimicrobium sp. TaxID=2029185 RepID=UPI002D178227|nr:prepilin-type N-terminal cleavage/methylation domain-containing protein [Longimicrobium sp.]HSU17677.1 prepilin-type N-terminal cleavage/methylation domain-containing protein [Longimicrobium sp.]
MRRTVRNTKGFTLIELMIVVVIIGILAALAIPRFTQASARAKEKEADGILKQVYTLQQTYYANNGTWATGFSDLTAVGWETPTGLKWYTAPTSVTFPVSMGGCTGKGYNTRQISDTGAITDNGAC